MSRSNTNGNTGDNHARGRIGYVRYCKRGNKHFVHGPRVGARSDNDAINQTRDGYVG